MLRRRYHHHRLYTSKHSNRSLLHNTTLPRSHSCRLIRSSLKSQAPIWASPGRMVSKEGLQPHVKVPKVMAHMAPEGRAPVLACAISCISNAENPWVR
jgi:hypothetical protein